MEFKKKRNELEVRLPNKVVRLKGHQDDDAFTIFTESLVTHPALSESEIKAIISETRKREDIVVR